jgi:hypothetical protein
VGVGATVDWMGDGVGAAEFVLAVEDGGLEGVALISSTA